VKRGKALSTLSTPQDGGSGERQRTVSNREALNLYPPFYPLVEKFQRISASNGIKQFGRFTQR
jgi:hypothetical protein